MNIKIAWIGALAMALSSSAFGVVLYAPADSSPTARGYLTYFALGTATNITAAGKTTLDTTGSNTATDDATAAGYSNYSPLGTPVNATFPVLDPTVGFTLSFDLLVDSQTNDDPNRAGFSVILEGSDKKGIELGFWADQIWAQSTTPLFNKAESFAFNPTVPFKSGDTTNHYDLTILNGNYSLSVDGTPLGSGLTRDYNSAAPVDLAHTAYHLPNYVFLGDDTAAARGAEEISAISINVPEPATMMLMTGLGSALMLRRRKI